MPTHAPYVFDEFFASGQEESISPFLTPSSRFWSHHLPLKVAIFSALLLLFAFISSFFLSPLSQLFLIFVYFLSGTPALLGALEDIKNMQINIDVLMTFAALLSVIIGSEIEGALLLVLFEFSGALENMVTAKTKGTLLHLHELSPRYAYVIEEDQTLHERSVKDITLNSLLLIKAGEIIPLDGLVVSGTSSVNLIHLTGESHPMTKQVGDEVQAGSRNLDGTLTIQVTRISSDSTLNRIIQLITQAQEGKPRLERFLDRFSTWYAMTIIGIFFLLASLLPWILSIPVLGLEGSLYRALTFLIAASPCALIIATPTAYLSALSACARQGILLKGGMILDAIATCKTIIFDKTGTLTTGKLSIVGLEPLGEIEPFLNTKRALAIAASLEQHSKHPIAEAIVHQAQLEQLPKIPVLDFKSIAGFGLEGLIELEGKATPVFIGREEFIAHQLPPPIHKMWHSLALKDRRKGYLSTLLLIGENLFIFHFLDTLRPESQAVITELQEKAGMHTVMLTGDYPDVAQAIAQHVGIKEVYANLRPEDKLAKVSMLSSTAHVIMIGDGVNDAPALARATVGISMGKLGSATAVDASDVIFLNDDLSQLDGLIKKAHQTTAIVKQNISLALGVIVCATIPAILGWVPLWMAVILHEGGTVLVGLNSLRLLDLFQKRPID